MMQDPDTATAPTGLLDVLHLLARRFERRLHLDDNPRNVCVVRLGTDGVDFAMDFQIGRAHV